MINTQEFKQFIGMTSVAYDDAISQIVNGVNKFAEAHCNNVLLRADVIEYFNADDIDCDDSLYLKTRINISDFLLYYNTGTEAVPVWTLEDRNNYALFLDEGSIGLNFARSVDSIQTGVNYSKATYKAWFTISNAPADLKLACLKLAGAFYNKRKGEGESMESLDGASVSFAGSVNDEIKQMLSKYKSIAI